MYVLAVQCKWLKLTNPYETIKWTYPPAAPITGSQNGTYSGHVLQTCSKICCVNHPPSPTMPRTSNLFITSPRVGAPPAGEMSCLGFSEGTPALTSGWRSEMYSPGETWTATVHTPCSLLYLLQLLLALFQPYVFFKCHFLFIYRFDSSCFSCLQLPLFHFLRLSVSYFYPNLHAVVPGRQDIKQRSKMLKHADKGSLQGLISHQSLHRQ